MPECESCGNYVGYTDLGPVELNIGSAMKLRWNACSDCRDKMLENGYKIIKALIKGGK